MIVFLVLAGAFITATLIADAASSLGRSAPVERASRGSWGIAEIAWPRRRRQLDAHARRWQTSIMAARRQQNRWPDLVTEIARLEAAAKLTPTDPPETFDRDWLRARLVALETQSDPKGER